MSTIRIKLTGTSPLVMHNNRLADPLDEMKKKIAALTGKRKKTDADHHEISRLEFLAGMYVNDDGPIIPARCLRASLIEGAKRDKMGTVFKTGLFVEDDARLDYDGPRDSKGLWESGFFWRCPVGNQSSTVIRTRPVFNDWSCEFSVWFDNTLINLDQIENALLHAGKIGICDARALGRGKFKAVILTDAMQPSVIGHDL